MIQIDNPKAITGLKYMLLMKIMLDSADEVTSILSGKLALRYAGPEINAMRSIAKAAANRSVLFRFDQWQCKIDLK